MTTKVGRKLSIVAMALALIGLAPCGVAAQQGSQSTIRFIVGTSAGGVVDPYARLVADHMAKSLSRTIVVENKPGANGNISARMVVDAPADGTLVWVGTQSMTEINPSAYKELRWSIDDFVPIIRGVEAPLVLVTHPSVPATTLADLISWAKAKSGQLSYASFSPGTPSHFLGHQLNLRFGLDLAHLPYRGAAPQSNDLVAGHALLGFTQLGVAAPLAGSGKLKAIATTGPARSRLFPDVPTFAELGHPEFNASIWFGLLVKAGTPPDLIENLTAAAQAAHADAQIRAKLEQMGFDIPGRTGPSLLPEIKAQIARWAALVKAAGFKAD